MAGAAVTIGRMAELYEMRHRHLQIYQASH